LRFTLGYSDRLLEPELEVWPKTGQFSASATLSPSEDAQLHSAPLRGYRTEEL